VKNRSEIVAPMRNPGVPRSASSHSPIHARQVPSTNPEKPLSATETSYAEFKRRLAHEKTLEIERAPFKNLKGDKEVLKNTLARRKEKWDETVYLHHGTKVVDADTGKILRYVVSYTEAPNTSLDLVHKEVTDMGVTDAACYTDPKGRAEQTVYLVWPKGRPVELVDFNRKTGKVEKFRSTRYVDKVECWVSWGQTTVVIKELKSSGTEDNEQGGD